MYYQQMLAHICRAMHIRVCTLIEMVLHKLLKARNGFLQVDIPGPLMATRTILVFFTVADTPLQAGEAGRGGGGGGGGWGGGGLLPPPPPPHRTGDQDN